MEECAGMGIASLEEVYDAAELNNCWGSDTIIARTVSAA